MLLEESHIPLEDLQHLSLDSPAALLRQTLSKKPVRHPLQISNLPLFHTTFNDQRLQCTTIHQSLLPHPNLGTMKCVVFST